MFINPSMPSNMKHNFSQVPSADIPRSSFDRSCGFKTTFNSGYLVPFFVDEVLPGDTFNVNAVLFARMETLKVPYMDNLYLDTFYFFVPNRLIWDNWQKFNGEQTDPGDSTDFLVPIMVSPPPTEEPETPGGYLPQSLSDYFGIPTLVPGLEHISLWHRAYNLIWNEWFRDQNLQDSVVVDRDNGPDDPSDYVLLRRGKRHDYFTSCLPWPQKGPAVQLPLSGNAPVTSDITLGDTTAFKWWQASKSVVVGGGADVPAHRLYADLTDVAAATINQLRESFQVQRLYERDARGGTRYTEIIRSHFGVVSPDARLQRPEYLGGGQTPVTVNPVAQTSSTDGTTPQANLAAIGTLYGKSHGFTKSFTEHGVILGLMSVRADLSYQQGLNRMFSRRTRFDFYWPALSHLGEQAVLNKEIYAQGSVDPTEDDEVFGYQERWAEYRYKPSLVTGKFRSTDPQSLDIWHLAQEFASLPELNDEFIVDNPPVDRIVAVPTEPQFILDASISIRCARPMPVYSVPGLIDHF